MTFIKSTIISLPTDKATENCIIKEKLSGNLFVATRTNYGNKIFDAGVKESQYADILQPMHLYFVVDPEDEKVDIDDWYIVELFKITGESDGFYLEQCKTLDTNGREYIWVNGQDVKTTRHINNCKKIIATTNPFLTDKDGKQFPIPTNEFLHRFCQLKTLNKVLVAYENDYSAMPEDENEMHLPWRAYVDYKIKVSDDNTISIAPLKQHYNRDEVTQLLKRFAIKIDELYKEHMKKPFAIDEYNKNKDNFLDCLDT